MDGYTAGAIACHHGLNAIQQQMQAQNSCNDFFYRFQITFDSILRVFSLLSLYNSMIKT
jgi:hypothetical protein